MGGSWDPDDYYENESPTLKIEYKRPSFLSRYGRFLSEVYAPVFFLMMALAPYIILFVLLMLMLS